MVLAAFGRTSERVSDGSERISGGSERISDGNRRKIEFYVIMSLL
jgi:hypothetical protein